MLFCETPIRGVYVIDPQPHLDERGSFARTWCRQEFADRGLNAEVAQCATSFNHQAGTLRGLHYQAAPHAEAKLVRCTQGAVYDVVVDLRPGSPTLHGHFAVELTSENRRMVYVPPGCAHGFLTLADNTEVFYQMSQAHHSASSRGVRWDDPTLGIRWPQVGVHVVSDRDAALPLVSEARAVLATCGSRPRDLEARV